MTSAANAAPRPMVIAGWWFPERGSRRLPARLEVLIETGEACVRTDDPGASVLPLDLSVMTVSTRVGRIPRRLSWPDGAVLETDDNDAVDRLMRTLGRGRSASWAHGLERGGWRFVAAVVVMLVAAYGILVHGVPAAADGVAGVLPDSVAQAADEQALWTVEQMTAPSKAPAGTREDLQALVDELALAAKHEGRLTLLLRDGAGGIGANALALPGGTLVVTDQMLDLMEDPDHMAAVLAHEIAHVEERHGLRRVARAAAWTLMLTVVVEDVAAIGDLAATIPAVLVDAGYSRQFETEADSRAVAILRAAGRDPAAVPTALAKLAEMCDDACEGGWLDTHPGIQERVEETRVLAAQ